MNTDDRVREGLDHLQTAALELIAAARALLDVAEELVHEPGVAATVVRAASAAAGAAGIRSDRAGFSGEPAGRGADAHGGTDGDGGDGGSQVRRIPVA